MTSLRAFITEVDAQRGKIIAQERARLRSGEGEGAAGAGTGAGVAAAAGEGEGKVQAAGAGEGEREAGDLQSLLLSGSLQAVISAVSPVLLQRSELVLRLGQHRTHREDSLPDLGKDGTGAGPDAPFVGEALTEEELGRCEALLRAAVDELGATMTTLHSTPTLAYLLLRLPAASLERIPELRVACVGNVDSGKSTTLGVLTRGGLDDGRGRARVALFRHKHEVESGRTSSVGMEILGFAASGEPVFPSAGMETAAGSAAKREKLGWDDIIRKSAKIVSFIDLAGHEKYLKTTLYGMTSQNADCVMLMVGANAGLIGMSKEHLAIALALSVPVIVAITKVDMTPANVLEATVRSVVKILRSPGCRKTPVFVRSREAAVEVSQGFTKDRICPIFLISNVSGLGLDLLRTFINLTPSSQGDEDKYLLDAPLEYAITEVWSVPYVGTVVNGTLNAGRVRAGDTVLLGPDGHGAFGNVTVKSIQRKRAAVEVAEAGQSVSFALKRVRRGAVRKGMVIVAKTEGAVPRAVRRFEGQVLILYHNTTLQRNYQAMLHCGAVRQTVRIVSIDHPQGLLRTGDRATVVFEFVVEPEWLREGMKLLFREGKTKGLGVVTRLIYG